METNWRDVSPLKREFEQPAALQGTEGMVGFCANLRLQAQPLFRRRDSRAVRRRDRTQVPVNLRSATTQRDPPNCLDDGSRGPSKDPGDGRCTEGGFKILIGIELPGSNDANGAVDV
jgi:hypothetical protein